MQPQGSFGITMCPYFAANRCCDNGNELRTKMNLLLVAYAKYMGGFYFHLSIQWNKCSSFLSTSIKLTQATLLCHLRNAHSSKFRFLHLSVHVLIEISGLDSTIH